MEALEGAEGVVVDVAAEPLFSEAFGEDAHDHNLESSVELVLEEESLVFVPEGGEGFESDVVADAFDAGALVFGGDGAADDTVYWEGLKEGLEVG